MVVHEMAQVAVAIVWGAGLSALGFLSLSAFASRGAEAVAAVMTLLFAVAILVTLGAADIFNVIDWMGRRFDHLEAFHRARG
jgi:hypothetical protein